MTKQAPAEAPRWPAVEYEERPWAIDDRGPISRTQRRRVTGPYEAAVPAEIAAIASVPTSKETATLAEEATAEVARFDGRVGTLLAPFSAVLLRSESAASSKIERLTASAKAIALAELGSPRSANARSIVANTTALRSAIELADHLDAEAIEATQRALLAGSSPDLMGWRHEPAWIGGSDFGPHHADFVPPHHERVRPAIDDLVAFLHRDDLPALTHAGIAHAQFETIHPFADGNGRTGRALIHSLLRARGVTTNVTVPVSAGLLTDTDGYFRSLDAYRAGDPDPIVRRLAEASLAAVHNGGILVAELQAIEAGWRERLTARRDSAAWRILELLIAQPAIDWPTLDRQLAITSPAAYRAIDRLVKADILTEVSNNRWGQIWAATEVLTALDAFAARAGRRNRG